MSARSAYRLIETPGAVSFAAAWDQAIARGIERLKTEALDRALNGSWVPVVRRGKVVRMEFRRHDRLAIALLSGRDSSVADRREHASYRHRYKMQLLEQREREAEEKLRAAELWAEHQAILDRIEEERKNPRLKPVTRLPRLRHL